MYDLQRAMAEAQEGIIFAIIHGNAMAYAKVIEHRARLSGLLADRLIIEFPDVRGALDAARRRARIVNPSLIEARYDPFEGMP